MTAKDKTLAFLQIASQFRLGHLVTESFHPKTAKLSQLVKEDLPAAFRLLQEVDADALGVLSSKEQEIWQLALHIRQTLDQGHKIFMCGCGATGRLSLVLETLFRQLTPGCDQVISFMAGGDYALIKSVESFEDRTEYGERQLLELGFGPMDMLLASTEGGETPFVIGAVQAAAKISSNAPYFLYCNPDELLSSIDRSREVLENKQIKKINLTVGPMAISGSTRMQASTVLMLSIGVGLLHDHKDGEAFSLYYRRLLGNLRSLCYEGMSPLTSKEADLYKKKHYLNYVSHPDLAISILTDTTERSPTFSLQGFRNRMDTEQGHSLSYLFVAGAQDSPQAWRQLLQRPPRALDWKDLPRDISQKMLLGFDISLQGLNQRTQQIPCVNFQVELQADEIFFECDGERVGFQASKDPLYNHLCVKMILNAHSTLIMGLLGRYEGNVMTYVRPSNNKLIDRATRYIQRILSQRGREVDYSTVVEKIFEEMEKTEQKPGVLRVVDRL
jgi:N-acetylmuramic acid 6-phosphate etherase